VIPTSELTDLDYEILEKVADAPIQKQELIELFPKQNAVELRVKNLLQQDFRNIPASAFPIPIPNTSYLREITITEGDKWSIQKVTRTGRIEITELGKKALDDWHLQKEESRKKLREYRFWKIGPMIISLIALIVAIISLLQSLHWIHLEKSELLPMPPSHTDIEVHSSTQPPQSP